jgi:hypothetical protein
MPNTDSSGSKEPRHGCNLLLRLGRHHSHQSPSRPRRLPRQISDVVRNAWSRFKETWEEKKIDVQQEPAQWIQGRNPWCFFSCLLATEASIYHPVAVTSTPPAWLHRPYPRRRRANLHPRDCTGRASREIRCKSSQLSICRNSATWFLPVRFGRRETLRHYILPTLDRGPRRRQQKTPSASV